MIFILDSAVVESHQVMSVLLFATDDCVALDHNFQIRVDSVKTYGLNSLQAIDLTTCIYTLCYLDIFGRTWRHVQLVEAI